MATTTRIVWCLFFLCLISGIQGKKHRNKRSHSKRMYSREATRCLECTEQDDLTFEDCLARQQYETCSQPNPDCKTELINKDDKLVFTSKCIGYETCLEESGNEPYQNQCEQPPIIVTDRCQYCCEADNLAEGDYCAPPGPANPPPTINYGEYGCQDYETSFNGHCYLFKSTLKSFHQAREWCADNGYALASILSNKEFKFLRDKAAEDGYEAWWVGARIKDESLPPQMETNWKWVDGQDWAWDLVDVFHPNAPVGTPDDQHFAAALKKTTDNYSYYLYDQSLNSKNKFICRRGDGSPLADRWAVAHSLWRDRSNDCKCTTWGDPHYISFDGMQHDYQGNCTYIHVIDKKHNPSLFTINVKTQVPYQDAPVSMVYRVVVKAYNYKITLNRYKQVLVNDYPVTLPHSPFGGLHIMHSGRYVLLLSSYGFWVKYDGEYRLVIGVSRGYEGYTAGVCGVCDGNKTNDDLKPNGQHASNSNRFLNSWNIDGSCAGATEVEEQCPGGDVSTYSDECGMIKNTNGVFADCHDVIDPEFPYQSCLYDMCHGRNGDEKDEALCYSLTNYFDMCKEAGVHLATFRTGAFCPLTCPSHSHYSACMSPCPATCATAGDCVYSPSQCVEGCECDTNYVLAGSRCMHKTNCGCLDDFGSFHANGDVWLSPDCRRECSCQDMNYIRCNTLPDCQENSECVALNGVRACRCIPGYEEDSAGHCIASEMCDSSDKEFEGNCYKIVNSPASSFENAKTLCEQHDYQLASILSEAEYSFLRLTLALPEYGRDGYWVGASGKDGSEVGSVQRVWRWITGDLWTWRLEDMFASGTPDNEGGHEFCGALTKGEHYYMDDETCGTEYGFVCKKDGGPVHDRWVQHNTLWTNTEEYCKCFVFGDPHYKTFDGRKIHFQGTCTYTLLMDWAHVNEPWFIVNAKNTLPFEGATVSLVRFVIIRTHGIRIILKRMKEVTVDDVKITLPHNPHPGVSIIKSGLYVMVLTDLGFWVQYDGMYKVKVGLDRNYGNQARGMCGLCDGNQGNDYLRPDGLFATSDVDFGNSWLVEDSCGPGEREVTRDEPICPSQNAADYNTESLCGRISDPSGHFASCHSVEPPQFYVESCVYDMCHALDADERERVLCYSLSAYLEACRDAGVEISTFRTPFFCPYPCPPSSTFNGCTSPCPPTCMSPNGCEYTRCVEGCDCHEGYVMIGDKCVPKSDCGCVDSDGNLHERDDVWITSDCKRRCRCKGLDKVRCTHLSGCPAHSHCAGQAGTFECQCDEGYYLGDDGKCIENRLEEYACRDQCHGVCRNQGCDSGEMLAPDSCRCGGSILDTCCIDNPHVVECSDHGGVCRSSCDAAETLCTSSDCKCYGTDSKCCLTAPAGLQCEASPCNGQCRVVCQVNEVPTRSGCNCAGGKTCCIPDPRKLMCEQNCGGNCRDECLTENGERSMDSNCVCSAAGKVCCKQFAYMIGDPHVMRLNGRELSTQGLCTYILMQDCVNTPMDFKIVATTKERLYITKEASTVESVTIFASGKTIQLYEKTTVKVDDELVSLPSEPDEKISISEIAYDRDGVHYKVKVTLVGHLQILWDGKNAVTIDLVGDLRGKVCGLFGSGDSSADMLKPDGSRANNIDEFINSWVVQGSCRQREKREVDY